jgi:hypothetical protein
MNSVMTGKIFDIIHISDKSAQIVLRKKEGDKFILVAVSIFGYWRDKAINELNLKPKDKIKGKLYISSRLTKDKSRYWTDVCFKEIFVLEKAVNINTLFVDKETGEIL